MPNLLYSVLAPWRVNHAALFITLCLFSGVAKPAYAQAGPELPVEGPDPDTLSLPEAIALVESRQLTRPDAEEVLLLAADSGDPGYASAMKRIAQNYSGDYRSISFLALHGLWVLGEPRDYFMQLARQHDADSHLAYYGVWVMAREPDSTTYAELRQMDAASAPGKFSDAVGTYGEVLELQHVISRNEIEGTPITPELKLLGLSNLVGEGFRFYTYENGGGRAIDRTQERDHQHPLVVWSRNRLRELAAQYPQEAQDVIDRIPTDLLFLDYQGSLTSAQWQRAISDFQQFVRETAFPDGVPAPSTFDASVKATVLQDGMTYTYTVENTPSSTQDVAGFYVDQLIGGQSNLTAPPGWNATLGTTLLEWEGSSTSPDLIAPGEQETRFSYAGVGVPHIVRHYVWGSDANFGASPEEIRASPVQGLTLAPRQFPNPYTPLAYLDTLRTYPQPAADAGWIADPVLATDIQGKYDLARTMLVAGDSQGAANLLTQVIFQMDMEHQGGRLSSEAYALLLWNTAFLLDTLPPDFPELNDVVPLLECVADNGNGTLTAYFGYDNLSGTLGEVPYGARNALTPSVCDRRQPAIFAMPNVVAGQPGRTLYYPKRAFEVTFNTGEEVIWTLTGRTAAASGSSTQCPQ